MTDLFSMGYEDYEKASAVCSETQLYKQGGNSIVVNVLEGIFNNLKPYFVETGDENRTGGC